MVASAGQTQHTRTGRLWPVVARCCIWLLLTLLVAQAFLSSSASAEEKSRFPKFMRWGKRYNPDYVVVDDSEFQDELKLPVFGTDDILCKNVASGGVYRCGKVPA